MELQGSVILQKKHRKKTGEAAGEEEGPNLMEDHEELEGDNTPGASPRDEKEAAVLENHVDAEKVKKLFLILLFPIMSAQV